MIPVAKALDIVLSNTKTLQPVDLPLCDIRAGQIVARDVVAQENVPAYPASVMDGYAVIATDGPGDYIVRGSSTAGSKEGTVTAENPLLSGQIVRIATGAPMPPGADAVVMVEDTVLLESTHKTNDAGEEEEEELRVRILGSGRVEPGQHVRSIGHDLQKGTTVLHAGDAITTVGGEIGTLAISGNRLFSMYVLPKIAVMSTGDEVIDVLGEDASKAGSGPLLDALSYGAIRDSNRPALIAALSALGCPVNDLGVVKDDPDLISESISKALETCEGVITTGGVSMGEKDWLKPVVDQRLGGQILFGRVAMKPSKPTTFATIPQTKNSTENNGQQKQKFVFALPGNPVSALVAFHMFVAPAIRLLSGHALNIAKGVVSGWDNTEEMLSVLRPSVKAAFEGPEITLDRVRPEYVRGMLAWSQKYNKWTAKLMDQKQQSSRMASMQSANILISLPCGSDAKRTVRHGELVTAIVIATPLFTF
ncbi:MoeA, N-terminal and linker domain-containing protein [Coemansia spiralis]|nr:MoeA, N-terminal and linker domain-containing protein [Coemansia spiralis]